MKGQFSNRLLKHFAGWTFAFFFDFSEDALFEQILKTTNQMFPPPVVIGSFSPLCKIRLRCRGRRRLGGWSGSPPAACPLWCWAPICLPPGRWRPGWCWAERCLNPGCCGSVCGQPVSDREHEGCGWKPGTKKELIDVWFWSIFDDDEIKHKKQIL